MNSMTFGTLQGASFAAHIARLLRHPPRSYILFRSDRLSAGIDDILALPPASRPDQKGQIGKRIGQAGMDIAEATIRFSQAHCGGMEDATR